MKTLLMIMLVMMTWSLSFNSWGEEFMGLVVVRKAKAKEWVNTLIITPQSQYMVGEEYGQSILSPHGQSISSPQSQPNNSQLSSIGQMSKSPRKGSLPIKGSYTSSPKTTAS